jgi:hypothetical protein
MPNLQEAHGVVSPTRQNNSNKSKAFHRRQLEALLRVRVQKSFKYEQLPGRDPSIPFGSNAQSMGEAMEEDMPRSVEGNTSMDDGCLLLPTYPRGNLYGHPGMKQDTYQQQYEVSVEQEQEQTTRQEDPENRALQQQYHSIKRKTVRELAL